MIVKEGVKGKLKESNTKLKIENELLQYHLRFASYLVSYTYISLHLLFLIFVYLFNFHWVAFESIFSYFRNWISRFSNFLFENIARHVFQWDAHRHPSHCWILALLHFSCVLSCGWGGGDRMEMKQNSEIAVVIVDRKG